MMNAGNLKGKTRQTSDWRRRMIAFVSALTLLISSCGLTAFAESDEDIYSDPVTAPIPAANTSPEPEEGGAEATPAPEGQPEEGTEPQEPTGESTGEGTETEGEPEVSEEPEDLTVYEPGTLTAEADGVGITVDYTAEARVPEGTVLTLTRAAGGDLYSALKSASKVLKTEENATWKRELGEDAVFYAITLTDSEGNEIHPETGVTLTCTNLEIPADATGFVTGDNAENLDWKDTLTVGFLPDAIGYAYLKQVQIGTVTLTHEDRDYMVTAAYGPDAGFPADTELKVREILPGTPEYALYSGMTDEALNEDWAEITLERYFDIAFVANGEELEPKANVDVQITFRDKIKENEETEVAAVHIENNEANVIEADTDSTKSAKHDDEAIDTVTFTSDSFSVYGVVQKKKIITKVLAADGNTYEIEISYTQEAEIPEESQVKVEEIPEGSDLWEAYRKQTAAALNADDVRLPGLYDISIIDAEGARIEPKAPVSVSIKLANAEANNEDLHVVHFTEEIPQELVEAEAQSEEQTEVQPIAEEDKIESENIKANVEGDTVTFDTQSFSVYAFAYTVDFYYGEYEYHLDGGTFMSLKNLLTILHIVEADQVQEFVNNIAEVTFSDPTLLSVSKVDEDITVGAIIEELGLEPVYGVFMSEDDIAAVKTTEIKAIDWALISLQAFQSHESLIISMINGDKYEIVVEDYQADFKVYVNHKAAGYIEKIRNEINGFAFNIQNENGKITYYEHISDRNNYGVNAVANSGFEFAFWVVKHSDGTLTKITSNTLASTDARAGDICVACFIGTGDKLVVFDDPEPIAWLWTGTSGSGDQTFWKAYDLNDIKYAVVNSCYLYHTEARNDHYNFLGWFDGDTLVSQGGSFQHEFNASSIDHNMVLTPKYELKEEYRDYRIVWLDGSDGVSSNVGDSTTLARINSRGNREGAGQQMLTVTPGQQITLPTTTTISFKKPLSDNLHHYAIDGWYDIKTGHFYQPGASVTIEHDTVFYASWFPENYNFATGSGAIATRDTSSFITNNLYDYNSIYNMKWLNLTTSYISSTSHYEEWSMSGNENDFIFLTTGGQWGRSINPHGRTIKNSNNEAGADNNHYNAWSAHIPMPVDLTNGTVPGVKSVGSANYLFRYDNTTGYYYYDSSKNKAAYGNNRFYVYNGTERTEPNYGTSDFLPFNDGQAEYNEPQGQPNYWFGMDTSIRFYLPDAPGTQVNGQTGNRSTKGDEMVYKFSGDDDVWVYLDDVLVLNMSGVHGLIYGEINFSQGTYTMAEGGTTKTVDGKGIMTYGSGGTITHGNLSDISGLSSKLTSGSHTIRMVYLERGASQSNCAIYFNLAPKTQKLKIRKVTDLEKGTTKHTVKDAEFQIYTESDYLNGGQPINPSETKQVAEMTGYYYGQTFVSDYVGRFFWGELPPGVYYIVETKAPHGLEALSDPIRMEINDTDSKIYYGPVSANNPTVFITKYTKDTADSSKYVDIYVNNSIKKGSIQVEKNWDESLASTETASKAILFRLERTPETDANSDGISGNGYGNDGNNGIYYDPEKYGLTSANIYEQNGTKYLKLNKNGNAWETLTISNLPMACVSKEEDQNGNQAVVPCYYRVVETGYLGTDDVFHAIDPELITVIYTATNALDDNGRTAVLARDDTPDTLTITNKTDFTNVEVQKLWADNNPYADSVTVKLYRSVDVQAQSVVNTDTTVHLSVTLTDTDSKATALTAHINGQDIALTKNGNVYTGDAVVPKGADYGITFTGTASDGYSVVIDNGEVLVGQNDEQNYSTTGIVNAPISVAQTRNITLTINWTGEGAWNNGNIWAQVWDSGWQNSTGFNSLFSQGHTTATAVGVSTGADVVQLGGGFVYDNYEFSLNPSAQYEKNGEEVLFFNVPAGTEDVSYTLTITPKNSGNEAEKAIVYVYDAYNNNPLRYTWTNASNGNEFHVGDTVSISYNQYKWAGNANEVAWTGVENITGRSYGSLSTPFSFKITDPVVKLYFDENEGMGYVITITGNGNTSREIKKALRFRAEAGASSGGESPVITTIALNHDAASSSTSVTGNENWLAVSDMEQVGEAVVLAAGSGSDDGKSWYYKWENLPAVDENGRAYHYYVVEDVPANTDQVVYSRTETLSLTNITITNTPTDTPTYAAFSAKKVVSGVTTNRDFFIRLKREKNGAAEWLNRTDASTWNWGAEAAATEFSFKDGETLRFTGLEIGYTYTAVEDTGTGKVEVGGYIYDLAASQSSAGASIPDAASANPDTVTITNVYSRIPEPGTLVINKEVTSGSADPTDTVFTFDVTFSNSDDSAYTGSVSVTDSTRTEATTVTADETGKVTVTVLGTGTATISNIPAGKTYTVTEVSIPDDWNYVGQTASDGADGTIASNETETVTITNESLTTVYAKKVWLQGTESMTVWPAEKTVTFQLQYNAAEAGQTENWQPVTADARENAITDVTVDSLDTVEFHNLRNDLTYRVVETAVDGTELEEAIVAEGIGNGTPETPLTVTNDIPTDIEVSKAWYDAADTSWPQNVKSVTVGLFRGNDPVKDPADISKDYTASVTALQNATFTGIPVYDEQGEEISYNVKELCVILNDDHDTQVDTTDNFTKVTFDGKDWTVTNANVTNGSATITNSTVSTSFIVKKEWIDVLNYDEMPAVHFKLMYYITNVDTPENDGGTHVFTDSNGRVYDNEVLSKDNNWTWRCPVKLPADDGKGHAYRYFVDEIRINNTKYVQFDTTGMDGTMANYRRIVVKGYESSQGHVTEAIDNPKPFQAYIEGDTGTITVKNLAPGGYIQMDLKKKYLEYKNGALYTTTCTDEMTTGRAIRVQIYRRAVANKEVNVDGYHLAAGETLPVISGWAKYGSSILLGYDESGKDFYEKGDNPFPIEYCSGWHWTIARSDHYRGLPKYGYHDGVPVKYQYVLVEEAAYKYVNHQLVQEDDLIAILPAVWMGSQDEGHAQAQQIIEFPRDIGHDQDRLINVRAFKLHITKEWAGGIVGADKIYVKVYRYNSQSLGSNTPEDYTDIINTGGFSVGDHSVSGDGICSDIVTVNGENYICLDASNNWSATIRDARIQGDSSVSSEAYRYWIEEKGYRIGITDYFDVTTFEPEYSIVSGTGDSTFDTTKSTGGPVIVLKQGDGTNHLKVINTPQVGSLNIVKALTNDTNTNDVFFTFDVVLTKADDSAYVGDVTVTDRNSTGVTRSTDSNGKLTIQISGEGTATITNIPAGTKYEITEKDVAGWSQVGEVAVTGGNANETIESGETETATITNQPTVDIPVHKIWAEDMPYADAVRFELRLNDGTKVTTDAFGEHITNNPVILNAGNNWTDTTTFVKLPKYNAAGAEIIYQVVETGVLFGDPAIETNWKNPSEYFTVGDPAQYETTGYSITNTPRVTEIEVTKVWTRNGESITPTQTSIGFEVYQVVNGTPTKLDSVLTAVGDATPTPNTSPTVNYVGSSWQTVTVSGLPVYILTASGYAPALYYVVETGVTGDTKITYQKTGAESDTETPSDAATSSGLITIYNKDYEIDINVLKIDETTRTASTQKPLKDAVFKLEKFIEATGASEAGYAAYPDATKAQQTSGDDGKLTFARLPDGKYRITEVTPPPGYYNGTIEIYFKIENGIVTYTNEAGAMIEAQDYVSYTPKSVENGTVAEFVVGNTPGAELPATGGSGTLVYTITGIFLITLAGTLLVARKRKANR